MLKKGSSVLMWLAKLVQADCKRKYPSILTRIMGKGLLQVPDTGASLYKGNLS